MNTPAENPNKKHLSFIEFCKVASQASAMSQSIPYYGRSPTKKIENVRRMINAL